MLTRSSVTAVSSGAVLRALNKSDGPQRVANSSYGFLRVQEYDKNCEGHKYAKPFLDPFDKQLSVKVLEYFMFRVFILPIIYILDIDPPSYYFQGHHD